MLYWLHMYNAGQWCSGQIGAHGYMHKKSHAWWHNYVPGEGRVPSTALSCCLLRWIKTFSYWFIYHTWQAADLEEAAELINPVRVAATLNSLATVRGRGPCAMSDWKEVIAAPTRGEKVRYFCHSSGAQQYEVPESYVPHSLIASPGTVTSGIRIDQNFKSSSNRPDSASSVLWFCTL